MAAPVSRRLWLWALRWHHRVREVAGRSGGSRRPRCQHRGCHLLDLAIMLKLHVTCSIHTPHFNAGYAHVCGISISGQWQIGDQLAEDEGAMLGRRTRLQLRGGRCFCHDLEAQYAPWLVMGACWERRALSRVIEGSLELSGAGGGAWMHGTMIHVGPHKVGLPCAPQHLRVKAVRIRNLPHRMHVHARKRRLRGETGLSTRHMSSQVFPSTLR